MRRLSLAFFLVFSLPPALQAVIKALTPLEALVNDSTYIVLVKVEKFHADKPAMMLTVSEDIKGKVPFRRLPVNLAVEPKDKEKTFQPEILKRLGDEQEMILFINQRGKKGAAFAFSNGTWFHLHGQRTGDDTAVWSFFTGEPFLRRTYKGTTAELKEILTHAVSGKKKPPAPNDKEPSGFGPEFGKKSSSLPGRGPVAGGLRLFAVVPTVMVGGPIAVLALLFPTIFGGVLVLFRQWAAFITLFSINSTLLLLYGFFGDSFRGSWLGEPAPLFFVMGCVSMLCFIWSWRRQVSNVSLGPAAVETPQRTENIVLGVFSGLLFLVMVFLMWLTGGDLQDVNNKLFLAIAVGVWVAGLIRVVKSISGRRSFAVPLSTEGVMILGTLIATTAFLVLQNQPVSATVSEGEAAGDVAFQFDATARWQYVTDESGVFVSTPLIAGDKIYAASAHPSFKFGILHCIDRATGKKLWTFDDDGGMKQVYSSPVLARGKLYIGEGFHDDPNCQLYCVDAATGKKHWAYQTQGQTESSPAVAEGRVYFGAGNVGFLCIDANSGENLWTFPGKDYKGRLLRFCSNPTIADGLVYTGTGVDRNQPLDKGETAVFCLEAKTGNLKWKTPVTIPCWAAPVLEGDRLYVALGTGDIVADASSYDATAKDKGTVLCLDKGTGKILWSQDFPNGIINDVALDEKHLYFGCRDGHCYCIAKKDGAAVWKSNMGSAVVASPALVRYEGRTESIVAVATFGRWASLDPATGKVQWAYQIKGDCHFTANPRVLSARLSREIYVAGAAGGDLLRGKATLFRHRDQVKEKE